MATLHQKIKSSFRDPGSYVFAIDGIVYRHIRSIAFPAYKKLLDSGLYEALTQEGLLVSHEDVTVQFMDIVGADEIIIRPQQIPFISYPYEWPFQALKTAALNTLRIQKIALDHGMTLQDATAFNLQFLESRWVFIDTGSFQIYDDSGPWRAYRQFCQHFLAPLLLMSYVDVRSLSLFAKFLDGIPLDLTARMLPLRARLRLGAWLHIVLHAKYAGKDFDRATKSAVNRPLRKVSKSSLYGLIDQLASLITSLDVIRENTAWTDYEATHTYNNEEYKQKENFILKAHKNSAAKTIWDMGANTGHFSRLVSGSANVVAFEYDFMTMENGCRMSQNMGKTMPLFIWMDIFNPTPSLGWNNEEWQSFSARGPADLVLALALIHHLCLAGNHTLAQIAAFFARIAKYIVIEFVPKEDPQSQRLLKTKGDIFPDYTQENFEKEMARHFTTLESQKISATGRTLYYLRTNE